MHGFKLFFHPVALKQMFIICIFDYALRMAWDKHFHLLSGHLVAGLALYQHFFDIIGIDIPDSALYQTAFFMNQARRFGRKCFFPDLVP